jgi:hypothetical protein
MSEIQDLIHNINNLFLEEFYGPALSALGLRSSYKHHQPINVPTAGAQALLMDHI